MCKQEIMLSIMRRPIFYSKHDDLYLIHVGVETKPFNPI